MTIMGGYIGLGPPSCAARVSLVVHKAVHVPRTWTSLDAYPYKFPSMLRRQRSRSKRCGSCRHAIGDSIYVFLGYNSLVVIRSRQTGLHSILGECFIYGLHDDMGFQGPLRGP